MIESGFSNAGEAEGVADAGDYSDASASAKRAEWAARLWRDLIELDNRLFQQKNIRLLTPEARVIINLKLSGPVSVTTAMELAGTSYRGFYAVLDRLRQAGIVSTVRDDQDQRVRKLSIDASAANLP